jgi:hypothetical protein
MNNKVKKYFLHLLGAYVHQFGYPQFAPHSGRQPPQNPAPISHGAHPQAIPEDQNRNNPAGEEASESSEFGGLVSYFSAQQELD